MTVSVLAGLVYWLRDRRWPYLLTSALAGGLALLTKAPAVVLPCYFGLVCAAGMLPSPAIRAGVGIAAGTFVRRPLMSSGLPLLLWVGAAAAMYVLLFPALWVDPIGRLRLLVEFAATTGLQPHDGNFFLGQPTLDDPGPFYYAVALPLRLSPLVAVGLALLVLPAPDPRQRQAVRWLLAFAVIFLVLLTLASKKFDRYALPVIPIADLLAGAGLWRLGLLIRKRGWWVGAYLMVLVALGQFAVLSSAWPFPIAYYNSLAGGSERARQLVMLGWGEGLEQAAAFLNEQPGAAGLYVVTSYEHVMRPRFVGTTIPIHLYFRSVPGQPSPVHALPEPDYVVLYVNAVQRRRVFPGRDLGEPVFVAQVNGQQYAWVFRVPRAGPRGSQPAPIDGPEGEEN
jgi:hypothetical protein